MVLFWLLLKRNIGILFLAGTPDGAALPPVKMCWLLQVTRQGIGSQVLSRRGGVPSLRQARGNIAFQVTEYFPIDAADVAGDGFSAIYIAVPFEGIQSLGKGGCDGQASAMEVLLVETQAADEFVGPRDEIAEHGVVVGLAAFPVFPKRGGSLFQPGSPGGIIPGMEELPGVIQEAVSGQRPWDELCPQHSKTCAVAIPAHLFRQAFRPFPDFGFFEEPEAERQGDFRGRPVAQDAVRDEFRADGTQGGVAAFSPGFRLLCIVCQFQREGEDSHHFGAIEG